MSNGTLTGTLGLGSALLVLLWSTQGRAQASQGRSVPKSATGSEVGFRTGYGIPHGKVSDAAGDQLSQSISGQLLLWLEAGYRVWPQLQVGGYFAYGFGRLGDRLDSQCINGLNCGIHDLRLGLGAQYHFAADPIDPWLGIGVGYEWLDLSSSGNAGGVDSTIQGFELVHLSGGLDLQVMPGFGVGPFAELALGKYRSVSSSCRSELTCANSSTRDIPQTSLHEWLLLGLRGTVVINYGPAISANQGSRG